jgi:hypothetical protein
MAAIEEALCEYLLSKSAVTNLIGSAGDARLYPVVLPETCNIADGAAVTYEIISSIETELLSDRAGVVQSRFQITTFANSHAAAMAVSRAIKNCGITTLKGVSGGVDIRGVMIEDGIKCYGEQPTDGSDSWRFVAEFDLRISYLEG